MSGRLIAIVGPSGVGKDSVIDALVTLRPEIVRVRRVITRRAEAGGEPFDAVSEAEFATRAARGDFALSWQAHGLHYGVPVGVADRISDGRDAVVNLSRGVLAEAAAVFPTLAVFRLTVEPEILAQRLDARGRETPQDIARRLARAAAEMPRDVPAASIDNTGPVGAAAEAILSRLTPAKV